MTVLDQVRKLERELIDRLQELEPRIREYEALREIAQRLDLAYTPGSAASVDAAGKATTARRNPGAKRASAKATGTRSSARRAAAKPRRRRAASKKAKA